MTDSCDAPYNRGAAEDLLCGRRIRHQTQIDADVAIIGGGASGTLAAIHLLSDRRANLRVVMFESRAVATNLGVAYGTTDPNHLLNLRAETMSAFPDEPKHFADWAARAIGAMPTDFVPRLIYGRYLKELVDMLRDDRLTVVHSQVQDVVARDAAFDVVSGEHLTRVGSVILAYGVGAPRELAMTRSNPPASWHVQSPWDPGALAGVRDDAAVVLVGSGLTAVDCAMTLLDGFPRRRVFMVSRRGELPRRHLDQVQPTWNLEVPIGPLTAEGMAKLISDQVAAAARRGVDWRAVVDSVRPHTASIWRRLDLEQRRRFLSDYSHRWSIHRNRMAPQNASKIREYRQAGNLTLLSGGIQAKVDRSGNGCRVELIDRVVEAAAVVNCTGPSTDITATTNPLLWALLRRGLIRPDPLRLGVACTQRGQIRDGDGKVVPGMYILGPPSRGEVWEAMSVPEIRNQAVRIADQLKSIQGTGVRPTASQ